MSQDRDKMQLTRTVVFELTQALKFKSVLPDENLLLLVQVSLTRIDWFDSIIVMNSY